MAIPKRSAQVPTAPKPVRQLSRFARHAVYAERHSRDASRDYGVLLGVADPHHAEAGRDEDNRCHGLELVVLEEAYVLQAVRLLTWRIVSSTFFGVIFSFRARTMDASFTSLEKMGNLQKLSPRCESRRNIV